MSKATLTLSFFDQYVAAQADDEHEFTFRFFDTASGREVSGATLSAGERIPILGRSLYRCAIQARWVGLDRFDDGMGGW